MTTPTLAHANNPSLLDKTIVLEPQNQKRTCSQASYSGMTFFSDAAKKKRGNVDLKMGPDFRPHFEVRVTLKKVIMLVSRFVFFTPHCWNWRGTCLGRWFLVRFSDLILGSKTMVLSKKEGCWGHGVVVVIPVFRAALVTVLLVVLVLFRVLSWLQFCAWTRVGFLRGRLVFFYVAVLVLDA